MKQQGPNPGQPQSLNAGYHFFGQVCRLPEDSPAQKALKEALKPVKKPRGKSKNTYLATLKKQLKLKGINTIEKAQRIARDRDIWRNILG